MMNRTKETLVLFALAMANTPLTLSNIAFRSGVSYNTVKKILDADDRVSKIGARPVMYHYAKPGVLDEQIVRLHKDIPKEGWVAWVEKIAHKLVEFVRVDKERLSDDVRKQGMVLEALGTNLILFGRELQKHSDKPDWFTLIGGNENEA
jgi:predicted transcriptional regulator